MTNREWLLNKMQNMSDEEFADVIRCEVLDREYRMNKQCESCLNCKINWLKSEHKEPITLSEAERIILENIDKECKWICRDDGGNLHVFTVRPKKAKNYWHFSSSYSLCAFNHLFQFITWNDEQPYNIEELLKGE